MSRHVADLIAAIDRRDADGIRVAYAPGARLVAMTSTTFQVHEGVDAVAAKVTEWYTNWEEAPAYSFSVRSRKGRGRRGVRAYVDV
jgi:hypothetical protein